MFSLRKRLIVFFTSYSSDPIVSRCRYISDFKNHEKSRTMGKLLNRGPKSKKKWYQSHISEPMDLIATKQPGSKQAVTNAQRLRARQLSHVLYDKITQIINTGELSEEILSKQVFITSVQMLGDFGGVNVYWDANRLDAVEIEPLLLAHARKLRSLLISYHVLGRIPPVTFVKDKKMVDLTMLNQLFDVADYGPDYVPSSNRKNTSAYVSSGVSARWSSSVDSQSSQAHDDTDFTFQASVEKDEYQHADSGNIQSSDLENADVNVMEGLKFRTNIYGLPHEDLMKKVTAHRSKVKSKPADTTEEDTTNFNIKQLRSLKDKMKLKTIGGSAKFKQQMLERDFEDLLDTASENNDYAEEEFNDNDDQWKET